MIRRLIELGIFSAIMALAVILIQIIGNFKEVFETFAKFLTEDTSIQGMVILGVSLLASYLVGKVVTGKILKITVCIVVFVFVMLMSAFILHGEEIIALFWETEEVMTAIQCFIAALIAYVALQVKDFIMRDNEE